MILHMRNHWGHSEQYTLEKPADFEPLFAKYPATLDLVFAARNLAEAAQRIAQYLNNHHLEVWVEDGSLTKGLRELGAALGIGLATLAPIAAEAPQVPTEMRQVDQKPFGSQPEDMFLHHIQNIESSGGKNVNHPPIRHGIHTGDTAIGRWGLMPNTITEMLNRRRKEGTITPDLEKLQTMNGSQMKEHLTKHPDLELNLARTLARHVLTRQRGNEHKAAYSWLMGHNNHPSDISAADLEHPYVKQYRASQEKLRLSRGVASMNKAENEPFAVKFKRWNDKRDEIARRRMPETTSHTYDPGRIRDDEEYEPKETSDIIRDYLADRGHKKS